MSIARFGAVAGVLAVLTQPAVARAQAPARAKLIVTVSDPSGAVIPAATVTVVGLDPATKAVAVPAAQTRDTGSATFDGLVPGRYSIRGEFAGFERIRSI